LIDVGEVTTFMLDQLLVECEKDDCPEAFLKVGDGIAPEESGWLAGTPNSGSFSAYMVLKPLGMVMSTQNIPLCDSVGVFFPVNYTLTSFNKTRATTDTLGAWSRTALKRLEGRHEIGDLVVKAWQVFIDSVAPATRDDSTYPQLWSSATNLHLYVARRP
jgi:hypothetical protein